MDLNEDTEPEPWVIEIEFSDARVTGRVSGWQDAEHPTDTLTIDEHGTIRSRSATVYIEFLDGTLTRDDEEIELEEGSYLVTAQGLYRKL